MDVAELRPEWMTLSGVNIAPFSRAGSDPKSVEHPYHVFRLLIDLFAGQEDLQERPEHKVIVAFFEFVEFPQVGYCRETEDCFPDHVSELCWQLKQHAST